jgi:hypothetical protein
LSGGGELTAVNWSGPAGKAKANRAMDHSGLSELPRKRPAAALDDGPLFAVGSSMSVSTVAGYPNPLAPV